MDASGLRGLDDRSLVHQEMSWEVELTRASLQHAGEALEDVSLLKKLRRSIARAQTIQREREVNAGVPVGSLRLEHGRSFVIPAVDGASEGGTQQSSGYLSGVAGRFGLGE